MKLLRQPILCMLALAAIAAPLAATAYTSATAPEGLQAVKSWQLDHVFLRPGAKLAGYRKVMLDPVIDVKFQADWLRNMNDRRPLPHLTDADAKRIADDAARSLYKIVGDAFKARGYEIVTAAGPDVLRVTTGISEFYVTAPEIDSAYVTRSFTRDDAGQATLTLEGRDSVSNQLLVTIVDGEEARTATHMSRATDVSNAFWFDAMYKRWAQNCVDVLQRGS
jgi:hypothetical protein